MVEPRNSFEHIDKLTYEIGPRLAGSQRARESAEYISQEFQDYGLNTEFQSFSFVDRVFRLRVMVLLFAAVLVVVPFLPSLLGLFFLVGGYVAAYLVPKALPKKTDRNVIGRLESDKEPEKKLLIGAHYDSANCIRNWKWIYSFEIALPIVLTALFVVSVFRFLLGPTGWLIAYGCVAVPYVLVCAIPFYVYEGNVSPGANDNASGASVLLEVARVMSESGPKDVEVVFVAFGAEEQGLVGSKYFAEEGEDFDYFLNLDSLGSGDDLALIEGNGVLRKDSTSSELNSMVEGGEELERVWIPFSIQDHIPFAEKDIPSTTLTSVDSREKNDWDNFLEKFFDLSNVRTIPLQEPHSLEDTPERISLENIEKSSNLVLDMMGVEEE